MCVSIELSNVHQSDDGAVSNAQILGMIRSMCKEAVNLTVLKNELTSLNYDLTLNMKSCIRPTGLNSSLNMTPRRMPAPPDECIPKSFTPSEIFPSGSTSESVAHSVTPSDYQSVSQSVSQSVAQSVAQSAPQSAPQSGVGQIVGQSVAESVEPLSVSDESESSG